MQVMEKVKISVVSYLNSKPFIYGLKHSELINNVELSLDIPSDCARKLLNGEVDLGLIPIAVIPKLKEHYIISDYCIGAEGKVTSVMMYSEVPLQEISTILLDYQSRTSVTLVKVLANNYWKISPTWINAEANFENNIKDTTAAVIIGDRTFGLENKYKYAYDLSEEWQKFTQLPFVFACWVANKPLPETFINSFNQALKFGLDNRTQLISELKELNVYHTDIADYLNHHIKFNYDTEKQIALKLFLSYCEKL